MRAGAKFEMNGIWARNTVMQCLRFGCLHRNILPLARPRAFFVAVAQGKQVTGRLPVRWRLMQRRTTPTIQP